MNIGAIGAFVAAATALLGSPGPGIAALLAVGRSKGWTRGLRYFAGLQFGLGAVVGLCGAGFVSLLTVSSAVTRAMNMGATIYLVYLSYAIAAAPVGGRQESPRSYSPLAGLWLGITNPKAYLAITSLLASPLRLIAEERSNVVLKMVLIMSVIIGVDLLWLWIGVALGRTRLSAMGERIMNVVLGTTILIATVFAI
jgi:threonine/homoserine/homoserine lactone efflux protein